MKQHKGTQITTIWSMFKGSNSEYMYGTSHLFTATYWSWVRLQTPFKALYVGNTAASTKWLPLEQVAEEGKTQGLLRWPLNIKRRVDKITGKLPNQLNADECVGVYWIIHHLNTANVKLLIRLLTVFLHFHIFVMCNILLFAEFTKKHISGSWGDISGCPPLEAWEPEYNL